MNKFEAMKLSITELATIVTALELDIKQARELADENLSEASAKFANDYADKVQVVRDKVKAELKSRIKT